MRLAAALGTALKRGARVVASRDSGAGVPDDQAGDDHGPQLDRRRRRRPARARRRRSTGTSLKTQGFDAGVHVGAELRRPGGDLDPLLRAAGHPAQPALQKEIEKHFTRQELRRVAVGEVGAIVYPARVRESYAHDLLASLDAEAIRERGFRIVVDYGYSAASFVLPLVLGPLGVEAVSAHGFFADGRRRARARSRRRSARRSASSRPSAPTSGPSSTGAAERLYLVDEPGREVPVEQALLLFLRLSARTGRTRQASRSRDRHEPGRRARRGSGLEVVRTPTSLAELTRAAAERRRRLRGRGRRRLRLPGLPARLRRRREPGKLLELLAPRRARRSPSSSPSCRSPTLVHRQCPARGRCKGLVMRRPDRAARRTARSTCSTASRLIGRARLGAGAARTRTSRSSTSTPRADDRGVSSELEPSCGSSWRRSCRETRTGTNRGETRRNLKLRLTLRGAACFTGARRT